ncbi:MAG: sodium-dependent transporter [Lachnospiraceae bacterium]|jgi:NSS family neurotransmitter:Na+ symporter
MQNRDTFKSSWGFTLACIGSAVGMGNIWRFPIMVSIYGGLTFLLPYFFFAILIASSGVMGEIALGRFAAAGPVGAFGKCTKDRFGTSKPGRIIGAVPVIGALGMAIGYTVVMGWITRYFFMGITGSLYEMGTDMDIIVGSFGTIAPEASTLSEAVKMMVTGGIFNVGNTGWLIGGLVIALLIISFGVSGGIEKTNKILMPALFALLVILGIYIVTLNGASEGYKYIFTLKPEGLADPKVWIYAFGQAFFSLSVAGNGSVIYGSYLSKKADIPSSARVIALFDTIAAMLAACVILPAMAAGGVEPSSGGPGLMFIYLVNVLNNMTGGRVIGMIFFICVFFAGTSSIINLYEVPIAWMQDNLKTGRIPSVFIVGTVGVVTAILIQPWTSQWMDMVSIYICPIGALLAGIMFFWILKKENVLRAVNEGAKKKVGAWFIPLGKYLYCACALVALIAGILLNGIG